MKRILVALILLASVLTIHAQERRVQNRPYTDLRDFHFGVLVGTHLQDLELNNVLVLQIGSIPKFDDAKVEIISGIPKHIDKNYKYLDGIKIKNMKHSIC